MRRLTDKNIKSNFFKAVFFSTLLSTILLYFYPEICALLFLLTLPLYKLGIDPVKSGFSVPLILTLGALGVLMPGIILNIFLSQKLSRKNKILSILFYILLVAIIILLFSESIFYKLNHLSIK